MSVPATYCCRRQTYLNETRVEISRCGLIPASSRHPGKPGWSRGVRPICRSQNLKTRLPRLRTSGVRQLLRPRLHLSAQRAKEASCHVPEFSFLHFKIWIFMKPASFVTLCILSYAFKDISLRPRCLTTRGAQGTKWGENPCSRAGPTGAWETLRPPVRSQPLVRKTWARHTRSV